MTRINAGIKPSLLSDKHLIAEHREIKRIPNAIKNRKVNWDKPIPEKFTLGTGHVRFFYNKIAYLEQRYQRLYLECVARGFKVTNFSDAFSVYHSDYSAQSNMELHKKVWHHWTATPEAKKLIEERIKDRNNGIK